MNKEIERFKVIRKPEVLELICLSTSSLERQIKQNFLPPPFSLGCRSVGWFEHEIISVIKARAAGKSDDEVKELVLNLVKLRSEN